MTDHAHTAAVIPLGPLKASAADPGKLTDEAARHSALVRYQVLDTSPEPAFEKVVALVKRLLDVPMVALVLIDSDRQWFKAKTGIKASVSGCGVALCADTIRSHGPMMVNDTRMNGCGVDVSLVRDTPQIRAYLGAPLATPDGYNIGALCAMDDKPREFSAADAETVMEFAELTMAQIELRQTAQLDALTSVLTRRAFMDELERVHHRTTGDRRSSPPATLVLFDLDHFKSINDTYGHGVGDAVLSRACRAVEEGLRRSDILGRIGGEEFAVLLRDCRPTDALAIVERMRAAIASASIPDAPYLKFTASFGIANIGQLASNPSTTVQEWMAAADEALYAAKRGGRNLTRVWTRGGGAA